MINANSGGGTAAKMLPTLLPAIKAVFPDHTIHYTKARGHAIELARQAAESGATTVVAMGGDGTLHEVVNGVLTAKGDRPSVGLIPGGRGSDFARGAGISRDVDRCLELLTRPPRPIDAGRVTLPDRVMHFINIADAGLGGFTVETANRWQLPISGQLTYLLATAWGTFSYSGSPMVLTYVDKDGQPGKMEGTFIVVAVCNGPFFGGGMHISPNAKLDDGIFEIVVIEARGVWHLVRHSPGLYNGTLPGRPGAHFLRVKKLTLASPDVVPYDVDGERAVGVPVTFEVMESALRFHLP